jgi:hypothetical protein
MLDVSKMDSEEKELWEMLTSKFTGKELIRVLELIAIDSKKHQKEQLLNSRLHGVVSITPAVLRSMAEELHQKLFYREVKGVKAIKALTDKSALERVAKLLEERS